MKGWIDGASGKWEEIKGLPLHLACCDCGLVHEISLKIVKGKLYFMLKRNERETKKMRKHA
jgi:hypothetical protein